MLHYTLSSRVKVRYNMHMVIVWALSWWYGSGWKRCLLSLRERLEASYDYFSIGLLARTLFSPYKQISAGQVRGPIGVQLRAFGDRLVSRIVGSVVRAILIVSGLVWLTAQTVVGLMVVILWGMIPFLPFIGFIMMLSGWVPAWR